ncbi:hypothetical protein [Paenibacillus sedimenti]|uniref:Uncharacterized protein n=1 Tax=Paenibacillus sedimenti TaxID=2770274 RepID=A0A926QHG7_9BACL|nr:hypothetical protein [Paenibacillus sedimenti]MBD0379526.1 hypothetical protein [Paenibacillus sedimenti]
MRFSVQYVPLDKIKPDVPAKMTSHLRKLRCLMWDCMHLLVVRKNRKDGSYSILLGNDRYEYLRSHTKKWAAPCLVDESKPRSQVKSWLTRLRSDTLLNNFPHINRERTTPATWSIVRRFLNEETRMKQLTRRQQIRVLALAFRYKKTVVASMKAKVDQYM